MWGVLGADLGSAFGALAEGHPGVQEKRREMGRRCGTHRSIGRFMGSPNIHRALYGIPQICGAFYGIPKHP